MSAVVFGKQEVSGVIVVVHVKQMIDEREIYLLIVWSIGQAFAHFINSNGYVKKRKRYMLSACRARAKRVPVRMLS